MKNVILCVAAFILSVGVLLPKDANAYGYTVYHGFYEHPYNSTYNFQSLSSGVYHRQDNAFVSGVTSTIFAEAYGYPPIEGEDWRFDLYDSETNQLLGSVVYFYSGGCLYYDVGYGPVGLGCLADPSGVYQFYFIGTFYVQCLDTKQYHHIASHSNVTVPQNDFEPTEFQPDAAQISADSLLSMRPLLRGVSTADTTQIIISVQDNLGCGMPLENINLAIKNTIVPQSGSHVHFGSDTEIGTGKYTNGNPVILSSTDSDTSITSTTDQDGEFFGVYEAGIYGVRELVTVTVTNPETGEEIDTTGNLDIMVPGLAPLSNAGTIYTLAGTYSSSCDQGHNDGVSARRSHYLTSNTLLSVESMAAEYLVAANATLSFNDASLGYGGFFDAGDNSNRTLRCHVSHRKGVDLDVNRIDSQGRNLWDTNNTVPGANGAPEPILSVLDNLATAEGGYRIPEPGVSIHYRF